MSSSRGSLFGGVALAITQDTPVSDLGGPTWAADEAIDSTATTRPDRATGVQFGEVLQNQLNEVWQ